MMIKIIREFDKNVEELEKKLKEELAARGYKAVLELTPSDIVKDKLGEDMPIYRILYICNPKDFYNMIKVDYNIGSFAPCPVLIYEKDGKAYISLSVCEEVVDILKEPFEKVREAIMAV